MKKVLINLFISLFLICSNVFADDGISNQFHHKHEVLFGVINIQLTNLHELSELIITINYDYTNRDSELYLKNTVINIYDFIGKNKWTRGKLQKCENVTTKLFEVMIYDAKSLNYNNEHLIIFDNYVRVYLIYDNKMEFKDFDKSLDSNGIALEVVSKLFGKES